MTLNVNDGSFSYGKHHVLRGINFSAGSCDVVAILGANGAGKTTLLRCMMGILPWQNGCSEIDGKDIRSMSQRELWSKVAYVPQTSLTGSDQTALESVLIGRSSHLNVLERPSNTDLDMALNVLEKLNIRHIANKPCNNLSGGEKQMVLIARALVSQPHILILDEPESNLDFRNQLVVLNTISLLAQSGMTCIFNTHYPSHALQMANKSLLLEKNGTITFGKTTDVVTPQNIRHSFGVDTVLGEFESDGRILRSIVPISISTDNTSNQDDSRMAFGGITIILDDDDLSKRINDILSYYGGYIIGRMGMPYRKGRFHIIHITLDAPVDVMRNMYQDISVLQGVNAKLTLTQMEEGTL